MGQLSIANNVPDLNQQLKDKEQALELQQLKLAHFRSWMQNLQTRFLNHVPQLMKNARRLYVGGLQQDVEEEDLKIYLQDLMSQTGVLTKPGIAVLSCKIAQEKTFAFVEFRSVEETSNMLALDGIKYGVNYLKIRRPSNYDAAASLILGPTGPDPTISTQNLDICRTVVEDTVQKLFIGGLPCDWSEDQVKALLVQFGGLKSFNLVMDKATGKSRGYAFCEFQDDSLTDQAIQQLNGKRQGNKNLTVKRALEGPVKQNTKPNSTAQSNQPLLGTTLNQSTQNPDSPSISIDQLSEIMTKLSAQNNASMADRSKSAQLDALSGQFGFDIYMKQQNEQLKQAIGQQKQYQIEEIFRQGFIEGQNAGGVPSLGAKEQLAQLGLNSNSLYGPTTSQEPVFDFQNQNGNAQQSQLNQYLNNIVNGNGTQVGSGSPNQMQSSSGSYNQNVMDLLSSQKNGKGSSSNSSNSIQNVQNGIPPSSFSYNKTPISTVNNNSTQNLNNKLTSAFSENLNGNYKAPTPQIGGQNFSNIDRSQIMSQLMGAYQNINPKNLNGCYDNLNMAVPNQMTYQCW